MNLSRLAANYVVEEVTVHYRKAHIITMAENKMKHKVLKLHQEYASLRKLNPERRCDNPKMKQQDNALLVRRCKERDGR